MKHRRPEQSKARLARRQNQAPQGPAFRDPGSRNPNKSPGGTGRRTPPQVKADSHTAKEQ